MHQLDVHRLARGIHRVGVDQHALHAPYWWLKCLVGPTNDTHPAVRAYHRLLVWDIAEAPALTRTTERLLNPVLGKSVVVYSRRTTGSETADRAVTRNERPNAGAGGTDGSGDVGSSNGSNGTRTDAHLGDEALEGADRVTV